MTAVQQTSTHRVDPLMLAGAGQSDFLRYRTDTKNLLNNLQKSISAVTWDYVNKKWVQLPDQEPLAPPRFVNKIMSILTPIADPNSIHSNLDEQAIHDIVFSLCEELIWTMVQCGQEYGIRDENYGIILKIVENLCFITLSRAKDDGERTHQDNNFRSHESSTSAIMEAGSKRSGLWGR